MFANFISSSSSKTYILQSNSNIFMSQFIKPKLHFYFNGLQWRVVCVCVCVCVGMFMWFMRTQICIMTWVWHRYYKEKVIYEDIFSVPII